MNKRELKKVLHRHKGWLNNRCWGCKANLRSANLRFADLDFSSLPLWCGGQFKTDEKICKQLIAHTVRIMELSEIDQPDLIKMMNDYKKGWHREEEFLNEGV